MARQCSTPRTPTCTSYATSPLRLIRAVQRELTDLPLAVLRNMPGESGRALRVQYWRARLGALGARATIGKNVEIVNPQWVFLGDDCWVDDDVTLIAGPPSASRSMVDVGDQEVVSGCLEVGSRVHLARQVIVQAHGGVRIGDDTGIASGAKIFSLSHHHRNLADSTDETAFLFSVRCPAEQQMMMIGNVILEHSAAVAMNAVILPGARLRSFSWLGPNSVLARGAHPRGAMLQGIPATVRRMRPGFAAAADG